MKYCYNDHKEIINVHVQYNSINMTKKLFKYMLKTARYGN